MHRALQTAHRRLAALIGTAAVVGSLAAAAPSVSQAAPLTGPAVAASNCPSPYPVGAVHPGMLATGYTTSQGRTPRPFAVRVLGVLKDGIAPGIDLILIRAHSPAIKRAGGVWAGMSGSPIYARDGRLLGALSYSFSTGPSNTAGVTPASAMYRLLHMRGRTAGMVRHIGFDTAARSQLAHAGAGTAAQLSGGMQPITTPVSVSGVPARALGKVRRLMGRVVHGPFMLEAGGTVAPGATAPVSTMRPGAPFVAAVSTGDVTLAGIGTTTAVCKGRALAFGHPMIGGGPTRMTMHTGTVLYIQSDPTFSPFVMANVGGRTGVIKQDRLTGLRARLGAKPEHLTKFVTQVIASTGLRRTSRSYTPLIGWVPDTGANAVYGDMLATLQKYGVGTAKFGYAIFGRRDGGRAFHLRRSDYVTSQFDVAYQTADDLYAPLATLAYNRFRHVRINRVVTHVRVTDALREWTLKALQVRRHGVWQSPTRVRVTPGSTLHVRARLVQTNQIAPSRYVAFSLPVPARARRFGDIQVIGGESYYSRTGAGSFNGLLRALKHAPRNASLVVRVGFATARGFASTVHGVRLGRATTGSRSFGVRIGSPATT